MISFDTLPDSALVRLPIVKSLFGISTPTVWRWSKSGILPSPVKISGITCWQVGELRIKLLNISFQSVNIKSKRPPDGSPRKNNCTITKTSKTNSTEIPSSLEKSQDWSRQ